MCVCVCRRGGGGGGEGGGGLEFGPSNIKMGSVLSVFRKCLQFEKNVSKIHNKLFFQQYKNMNILIMSILCRIVTTVRICNSEKATERSGLTVSIVGLRM